jgi:lysophospholipase L1-like esterase
MKPFFRAGLMLVAVALCLAAIPACGPAAQTTGDAGMQAGVDAGPMDAGPVDAGPVDAGSVRHHSYIPAGLHPTNPSRVIVMGDSISAGYGTTNPSSGATPYPSLAYYSLLEANNDTVWPEETSVSLSAEFSTSNIPIVNVAVPGATTGSMISNPDQRASLDSKLFTGGATSVSGETIVVITIGGNDLVAQLESDLTSGSDATATQNLTNAISNIRSVINYFTAAKFPDGVAIYLANVYDPSGGTGMLSGACAQSIAGVNTPVSDKYIEGILANWESSYVSLGTELHFAVVDAHGGFLTHGVTATDTYFFHDCIHPNNEGHNELRNLFFEAIDGSYVAPDN